MREVLRRVRGAEREIAVRRKVLDTVLLLCLGVALGVFSKFLDATPSNRLPVLLEWLDLGNFLGRFAIWVLLGVCISVYSNSALRAALNVFVFLAGMVASYYLYSYFVAGFFPRSYAMIWAAFAAASPVLGFLCWYAKGDSKPGFVLSVLIFAVLFNLCFAYGWGYFAPRSLLEAVTFLTGFAVLRRKTWKGTALLGVLGLAVAVVLNLVVPFHFG